MVLYLRISETGNAKSFFPLSLEPQITSL